MAKIQKAVDSINNMTPDNAYPNGKHIDTLTAQIMKAKDTTPQIKMQLLVILYTNYYSMQHERAVRFDVLETSYESFMEVKYDSEGDSYLYENPIKYQKCYEHREAETRYIVNRDFRDNAVLLLDQIGLEQGSVDDYLKSLDEVSFAIINRSVRLKNDYWENLFEHKAGKYIPSKDEEELNGLFKYNIEKLTFKDRLESSPFPEYEPIPQPPIDFSKETKYGQSQVDGEQQEKLIVHTENNDQGQTQG